MTIYRYGLARRPLQIGAQPKGFILSPGTSRMEPDYDQPDQRFGTIDYPVKLSDADAKAYELSFLGEVERDDSETRYWQEKYMVVPT